MAARRRHDRVRIDRNDRWLIYAPILLVPLSVLFWLAWPSRIDPEIWNEPEPTELTGPLAPNNALANAEIVGQNDLGFVTDAAVAEDGLIYLATLTGEVLRLNRSNDGVWSSTPVARASNRHILGMAWISEHRLGIAGVDGLFALDTASGEVENLSTGSAAYPYGFINDLAVAHDGTVYFTDSSTQWNRYDTTGGYFGEMFENKPNGLVYRWEPATRRTEVVAEGLYYPNGIVVAPDGRSLYVSETFRYSIRRIWLDRTREESIETLASNLPGFPAGLAMDTSGNLFVAMTNPRWPLLTMARRHPFLAHQIMKLPASIFPTDDRQEGFLLRLSAESGEILESYQSTDAPVGNLSHLMHHPDGRLCFGTSYGEYLACMLLQEDPLLSDQGRITESETGP